MIIYENETKSLSYVYYDDDGNAVDISAKTPYLYVYRDIDDTAIASATGTVAGATGAFSFSVDAATVLSSLTSNRYYPYRVVLVESGELNIVVEDGILNYNKCYNPWEWFIDIYSGMTLTELLEDANSILRYEDWSDAKLTRFANKTLRDFSARTYYVKGEVRRDTEYDRNTYILPDDCLLIDELWVDNDEKIRDQDWIQKNRTIIFMNDVLEKDSSDNVLGGQTILIKCSKYVQTLLNANDYIELPRNAADTISDGIVFLAKREDRAPDDELRTAFELYKSGTDFFAELYTMDSLDQTTFSYENSYNYRTPNNPDSIFQ